MEWIPNQGFGWISFLRGSLGLIVLLALAYGCSSNKKNIPWKTVGLALFTQFLIGFAILKVPAVQLLFEQVGKFFIKVIEYTFAGSSFLFDALVDLTQSPYIFAFQVLPVIVFFSALTSLLYYYGIIQRVVGFLAWALGRIVKITGAESLSLSGNIFLGQTEAPLLIKAYLPKMSKSEIYTVMVGGMATVAGSVLAAYVGFLGGDDPKAQLAITQHLIAASVMAAPGAVAMAKIIVPPTSSVINAKTDMDKATVGNNLLDAIAEGTTQGVKLAVNVGAMLLVFVALLALINDVFGGLGNLTGINIWIEKYTAYNQLSLEFLLGYLLAPLMWIIGVAKEDVVLMGQLLGIKITASEFVAFIQLAEVKNTQTVVHLLHQKSVVMATFMLCGFANFSSIGIQLGGIGVLAPNQRKNLAELGLKAVIGGTLVSLVSATYAGIILG